MKKKHLACAAAAVALVAGPALACSTIIVGRDASATGRVIVGHNEDDDGELFVHHAMVPARTHAAGETMPAEKGKAAIPQVTATRGFFWSEVKAPWGGLPNSDTFLNDCGVFVTSNSGGCEPPDDAATTLTDGGIGYNLRRAVAERAHSAREAVDIVTNLVQTWGYYMPGRLYTVADGDEAWIVEVAKGRRYIARRVPDDAVAVVANCYTIHGPEAGDVIAPGVAAQISAAGGGFDFALAFQGERRRNHPANVYRQKHMYRIAAGRDFDKFDCPFSARPPRKVSADDVKAALSTHYEGTDDEVKPRHGDSYSAGRPVCRDSTIISTLCIFGDDLKSTELRLCNGSPCSAPFHSFRPFGGGLPAEIDESADAVARLENHVLPLGDTGGVDIAFLRGMLKIPSESMDQKANNDCIEYLRAWLEPRGVTCHVLVNDKGRKSLYAATTPGKRHDYLFVSHVDVVPAADPRQFEPHTVGDWIYARGACDTKGNVAVICRVLANLVGKASVGAFIATDEDGPTEGGTPTPRWSLEQGFVPKRFIMVGDSAGEEPDQLFTAEKGHARITITARGKGGHSSRPWALDNPIPKLAAAWSRLEAKMPPRPTAEDKWRDCLSPTMIKGSDAGNMIPDAAWMRFSLRFTEPDGYDRWVKFIADTTGLETARSATFRPPVVTDPEDPNVQAMFAALKRQIPAMRLGKMSAATDASYYAHLGLPIVIYAPTGEGPHAPDERISIRSLRDYAIALTKFLAATRRQDD